MTNHRDICKAWANGTAKTLKGYAIFTNGEGRIYSWGHHYIMGQIHETAAGRVALINSERYSVSTTKHTKYTMRAAHNAGLKTYVVPNVTNLYALENYAHLEACVEEARQKGKRARTYKDFWLREERARLNTLHTYINNYPRQGGKE